MPSRILTHSFSVDAAPAVVAAHLADPHSYLGLSPLIVAVREVHSVDGRPGVTGYTAVERFSALGLHYDNLIAVTLAADESDERRQVVGGNVVSPGGVRLSYRYTIEPAASDTRASSAAVTDAAARVTDTITVHAPFGLLRFACGQARSVQLSRALILAQRLATR
ncbi:SRPBCC family protein [Orlajensenia leifsoniae]|uniref:SRPBCC family protein n=1 Tax=Orlajensenia leifsoniae TaxID=2561933 RepID=A0A4Y9R3S3_9MICO|nr:SRPBCC family protein [Leifsonia flava]TFV98206.1 SRPBCC family protein [Leifsonia flava]